MSYVTLSEITSYLEGYPTESTKWNSYNPAQQNRLLLDACFEIDRMDDSFVGKRSNPKSNRAFPRVFDTVIQDRVDRINAYSSTIVVSRKDRWDPFVLHNTKIPEVVKDCTKYLVYMKIRTDGLKQLQDIRDFVGAESVKVSSISIGGIKEGKDFSNIVRDYLKDYMLLNYSLRNQSNGYLY